jgi:ribulose-phosphate 3-epimerase
MDGHFVPNLSFGVPLARAVRAATRLPVHSHLMVNEPEWLVEKLLPYSDLVWFHTEATDVPDHCLELIATAGKAAGISLNPNTPVDDLKEYLPRVADVLVMSVYPGFGGQQFMSESLDRIRRLRSLLAETGSKATISVDGGVSPANCRQVADAGCDVAIAGSAIFRSPDYAAAIRALSCGASVAASPGKRGEE